MEKRVKVGSTFWKTDWFAGVFTALLFLLFSGADLMQSLERKAYDLGLLSSLRFPGDRVAVIAIDDQSIANIGRWPWSREVMARMVDRLSEAGAKAVGNTVLLLEPQQDPGLAQVKKLVAFYDQSPLKTSPAPEAQQLGSLLLEAERSLDSDNVLAQSLKNAGNAELGMLFRLGEPQGRPDRPLPAYVASNALAVKGEVYPPLADQVYPPIPLMGSAAAGIGHLNYDADVDGVVRSDLLVVQYYDQYFPSLSLLLAAASLNLKPADIRVGPDGVALGKLHIDTGPSLRMHSHFYQGEGGKPAFPVDSFFDVYSGKIPAKKYQGKIVLIGATAAGVGTKQVTPVDADTPPVLTLAHSVSSILQEDFYVVPEWAGWAERGVFLLVTLYLILLLPRLGAGMAAAVTVLLLAAVLGAEFGLIVTQSLWLQLMAPVALLVAGHLVLTTKRHLLTEKGKIKSEAESAESNRLLGLAFQGQGQLDMAFDKFRKCPLDDSVMDLLYNLALDFERKRQFNKATSVFQYMADYNPQFRDLESRLARSKALEETVMLGAAGGRTNVSILADGSVEKPMLGRYAVERELGKGAMGVVYYGTDPKIGRVVAIKTMALSQEFDADELEEVKSRFFREAETAGRLNHPNIVTIYDAGEEHDLAYIAMEFLQGKDLTPHTKPDKLLPLGKVLKIMAKVAGALDYAHGQHVVHRDIKPANIMYEPESDTIKVTDFGIARITDSSKTKTGMVLGTPSYMSPEQLAGKKVDGRSDLFSLGVMFYQLLTGQLPFQGESMAELMFRIANEQPRDIRLLNPHLPDCVVEIVGRMLDKQPDKRFQTGGEVAQAIIKCASQIAAAMGRKA